MQPIDFSFDYEHKEQLLARSIIKPDMTVFDVGANVGDYTRLFSHLVGECGRVYAFEPTKEIFHRLIESSPFGNAKTVLTNTALYSSTGKHIFYEFQSGFEAFNSLAVPNTEHKPVRSVEVDTVALDDFCSHNNIDYIDYLKVDTEGAELEIFKGADEWLNKKRISFIQFEISKAFLAGFKISSGQVFQCLRDYGYSCHKINKDGGIGDKVRDTGEYQDNFIAEKRWG